MANKAKPLAEISARIFGNIVKPPGVRSPTKYLKKPLKGDAVYSYYEDINKANQLPETFRVLCTLNLFTDQRQEFTDSQKRLLKQRGKFPTKKGEGKRNTKKKK
eukprot:m.337856 g.337856  ORF g.337856 m.337856 type:complete len:104 (+) comp18248_c0_seq1:98-409(+)